MIVLAIDTSTPRSAVALFGENGEWETLLPAGRQASEILLPAVRELLRSSGLGLSSLSRLAVCRGPGSFTGTRVGISVGWGLSRSLAIPLELVGSLEALAESARGGAQTTVCPVLDAERGDLYLGEFDLGTDRATERAAPRVLPASEARSACPAGALYLDSERSAALPTPALSAARAVARFPREASGASLQALYVRDL